MHRRLSLLGVVVLVFTLLMPLASPTLAEDIPATPDDGAAQPVVDSDEDGVSDADDNCANTANVDQIDTDANGVGDVCDDAPAGEEPPPASGEPIAVSLDVPSITEASCETGEPIAASVLVPASTDAVTYGEVTAADNGDGISTFRYTVTLTVDDGSVLNDTLPDGYTRMSDTEALYSVTLTDPDCSQGMSRGGDVGIMGVIDEESCAGSSICIKVTISSPDTVASGGTLTYSLTLTRMDGNSVPFVNYFALDLPGSGWSIDSQDGRSCSLDDGELFCQALSLPLSTLGGSYSAVVSRTVTEACGSNITSQGGEIINTPVLNTGSFSTLVAQCEAVPQDPILSPGSCVNGVFLPPSIELAVTEGIQYDYSPKPLPLSGTVTVTATLVDDEVWGSTDWTPLPNGDRSKDFTVFSEDCVPGLDLTKTVTAVNGTPVDGPVLGLVTDDVVSYQIVATNSGTGVLNNVSVSDPTVADLACDSPGDTITLAPGQTVTCTATHIITDADMFIGAITNTASASGTYNTTTMTVDASATVLTAVANPSVHVTKSVSPGSLNAPGTVVYSFVIANNGNVELNGLELDDDMINGAQLDCDPSDGVQGLPSMLAEGGSVTCEVTFTVTQELLDTRDTLVNSATVNATANSDETVSSSSSATLALLRSPGLTIEKTATTPEGELVTTDTIITYTFAVSNSGNVTLDNIVVADELEGLTWDAGNPDGVVGSLAPQASTTLTATYVVTEVDVREGKVTNLAAASGELVDCRNSDEQQAFMQAEEDPCQVMSDTASVSVETNAIPTVVPTTPATQSPTPPATSSPTVPATPGKIVTTLPTTGQGPNDGGAGPIAASLIGIAFLMGGLALFTHRKNQRRLR